jgi:hypothetical protein
MSVTGFGFERSLLICLLLNAAVFWAAWFFAARRMSTSRSQALLDGALLGYAIQYASVGLAGLLGCLTLLGIFCFATCFVVALLAGGWSAGPIERQINPMHERLIVGGVSAFVVAFVLAFAHSQADLPVVSNDALTYHFPAAVQWIQQGRISLFQTWFFNPANTYSPLAGSTFIAWLLLPFGNDLAARFVEVPALLCVGLAMYRLCLVLSVRCTVAALVAGAAVLSRPIFMPCMMGKDDLFVAFFFVATLVALSPDRFRERFGAARLGIGLGLLLATKYTALLSAPILMLGIWGRTERTSPVGGFPEHPYGGRTPWRFTISTLVALLLAGPWYLRNWIITGNPVFPIAFPPLFTGLFSSGRSSAFSTWQGAISVMVDVHYGLPIVILLLTGTAVIGCLLFISSRTMPILRVCAVGPIVGMTIFYSTSPFPEVRFLLPVFLLMFACTGYVLERVLPENMTAALASFLLLVVSTLTLFAFSSVAVNFSVVAVVCASVCLGCYRWINGQPWRCGIGASVALLLLGGCIYVYWAAYCREYLVTQGFEQSELIELYPQDSRLWTWVNAHVPADAKVAYANLYFVYPLQGDWLRRRLVYIPTRADVTTLADLPRRRQQLPGERIVADTDKQTIEAPNRHSWMAHLKSDGCEYLIVGRGGATDTPPERRFADADPIHFVKLFGSTAGDVYSIQLFSDGIHLPDPAGHH